MGNQVLVVWTRGAGGGDFGRAGELISYGGGKGHQGTRWRHTHSGQAGRRPSVRRQRCLCNCRWLPEDQQQGTTPGCPFSGFHHFRLWLVLPQVFGDNKSLRRLLPPWSGPPLKTLTTTHEEQPGRWAGLGFGLLKGVGKIRG